MFVDILFDGDQISLRLAFHRACEELGIATNSDDAVRREQLAKLILSLAREGESEPTAHSAQSYLADAASDSTSSVGQKADCPVTRPSRAARPRASATQCSTM